MGRRWIAVESMEAKAVESKVEWFRRRKGRLSYFMGVDSSEHIDVAIEARHYILTAGLQLDFRGLSELRSYRDAFQNGICPCI